MVAASQAMTVNYTADIVYPSGEKFRIEGSFPMIAGSDANTLTAATISAATTALAADIQTKITSGVGSFLPPLATRQSIARGRT